jgi:hypothetical protein
VSVARSLVSMPRVHAPLETRKARTSLIDAEWDRIASHPSVEPTPAYGFQSSAAPAYVPTLGRQHVTLVHTDTLKMPLPVLVLRDAPARQQAPTDSPRPARSERPRQVANGGSLAPRADEVSQTLKSVPPLPRRWSIFQLGILAATTLVGFVAGYSVLFVTAMSSEAHLGAVAEQPQSVAVPPSAQVVGAVAETSPRAPEAKAVVVPTPVKELEATPSQLPNARATPKAPAKHSRAPVRHTPKTPKRANLASDNPY